MKQTVKTLDYRMHFDDVEAYIITIKNHKKSEQLSARCQQSCLQADQPFHVWDAFDGTSGAIVYPEHAENQDHYRFLKQMNDKLTITEVATILSHYSLWAHCVKLDIPIVILEHDAIMVNKYLWHDGWNQINYLGNYSQLQTGWPSFPPHSAATKNYKFICRAHAYAVDPAVARQLLSHVIRFGLSAPADMLIRADIFPIVQTGFYAFDAPDETTITGRNKNWHEHAKQIFSTFQ
jgi:GR25 family glycosyltransferase involved in LPS biosynthesis